jgi:hypothetical protein
MGPAPDIGSKRSISSSRRRRSCHLGRRGRASRLSGAATAAPHQGVRVRRATRPRPPRITAEAHIARSGRRRPSDPQRHRLARAVRAEAVHLPRLTLRSKPSSALVRRTS